MRHAILSSLLLSSAVLAGSQDHPPQAVHLADVGETVTLGSDTAPDVAWRLRVGPDHTDELTRFELPDEGEDRFGTRIRGYLHPPSSGEYRFWVASDDASELRLSTDDSPDHCSVIAGVAKWTGRRKWDDQPSQASGPIQLEAKRRYYVELLHKDGNGLDHGAVAWSGPDLPQQVIEGQYLSPWRAQGQPAAATGAISRELWRRVSGSTLDDLRRSPGFVGSAELRTENGATALLPHVPGRFVLDRVAGDGNVQGRSIVIVIAGMRTLLQSPGYTQLDEPMRNLALAWLGGDNIISEAARAKLPEWIETEGYVDLPAEQQKAAIDKWMRTPLMQQTWALSPTARASIEWIETEPLEFYTYWPNRKGPGFRRRARIEGEDFSIQGERADMVQIERAAVALAGIPKPLRDLISTIIIDEEDARQWNGGSSTIYVRVGGIPPQSSMDNTITHELGHLLDHQFSIMPGWADIAAKDVLPVSGYGNTNPTEDFAEFVRLYFSLIRDGQSPGSQLSVMYPNRWARLEPVLVQMLSPAATTLLSDVPATTTQLWLSAAKPDSARVGWAAPLYDAIPLADVPASPKRAYDHCLYAHATATYRYDLAGQWKRLTGVAALQKDHDGSVVFIVRGDGRELLRTDVIRGDAEHAFDLDITAVTRLELTVEDSGDGAGNDWGMWFDPQLSR